MKVIDNQIETLKSDLKSTIKKGSKISIAASCFSIYAFNELKEELSQIKECRFLFSTPYASERKRENISENLLRQKILFNAGLEVSLKDQIDQKNIAKECAAWFSQKVKFRANKTDHVMQNFVIVDDISYFPVEGITNVELGISQGRCTTNAKMKLDSPESTFFIQTFNNVWKDHKSLENVSDRVLEVLSTAYQDYSPETVYYFTINKIFNEFLEDLNDDILANERTGFRDSIIWKKLYSFQKDAALAIINKLEHYNGCILADSVGLGKTFTALAVIKYYETRNKSVLVLCPKKLSENWNTYRNNYTTNPLFADRFNYTVLYHTDLSRQKGESNGVLLESINWGNYDVVVIDESHNFRNGANSNSGENRYSKLMSKVISSGVKTKVLMLSATPVNNRFSDLKNQIALAYEGHAAELDKRLNTENSIDYIFKQAQSVFNKWRKLPQSERSFEALLGRLDLDFFEVLDAVTIARSRKHIKEYYDMSGIGPFPERLSPISRSPQLTTLDNSVNYTEIYDELMKLNLDIYTPLAYLRPEFKELYVKDTRKSHLNSGREEGIRRLMAINLLKRMESSVFSFRLSVERMLEYFYKTLDCIKTFDGGDFSIDDLDVTRELLNLLDEDEQNTEEFAVGKSQRIKLKHMDFKKWERKLKEDCRILVKVKRFVKPITPDFDYKLSELKKLIAYKQQNPINDDNKKVLIFTAFADTAEYLYDNISEYMKDTYDLCTGLVTGKHHGINNQGKIPKEINTVLACFSPKSKERDLVFGTKYGDIDILIASDCISEGQNLQDCDYCINYDIHWNPVRIIQRFGRIDRIGSQNKVIQLVNFWPDMELDDYIKLKDRVEDRMKAVNIVGAGDEYYLDDREQGDLEYRKQQLERLKDEVVDVEDFSDNINILDLGLNDFRMDLLAVDKQDNKINGIPDGIYSVVPVKDFPDGILFVFRCLNDKVEADKKNRIHPYYMICVDNNGNIIYDYMDFQKSLNLLRLSCKSVKKTDEALCGSFASNCCKNEDFVFSLCQKAIGSIIKDKSNSDLDSLFKPGGTKLLAEKYSEDDFRLISYFVIKAKV